MEVYLDYKLKQRIAGTMKGDLIPMNVFEEAAAEVLNLLYLNIFKKYVKLKGTTGTSMGNSISLSSGSASSNDVNIQ
jgi:hypothetical protein